MDPLLLSQIERERWVLGRSSQKQKPAHPGFSNFFAKSSKDEALSKSSIFVLSFLFSVLVSDSFVAVSESFWGDTWLTDWRTNRCEMFLSVKDIPNTCFGLKCRAC